eukprot:NODE_6261_length_263_cov_19.149533_g6178_i0.p2 GENE.NODE_6261_length_263_cov_19.149533_g6178_i0~~NODE_6261_length_263_cov_19.149533_g6178_i0.p2  ORF type:complete len:80 (-),score=25.25 NODE_6261_length_263_cov_19.149533_g6178_i0:24-236(-)
MGMNRGNHVISPYHLGEFGLEEDIPTWIKVDDDIFTAAMAEVTEQTKKCEGTGASYVGYYEAHPDETPPF